MRYLRLQPVNYRAATIIAVVIFFVLSAVLLMFNKKIGQRTPGIIGIVLAIALYGSLKGIWGDPDNDRRFH